MSLLRLNAIVSPLALCSLIAGAMMGLVPSQAQTSITNSLSNPTNINISNGVVQSSVRRLGVNLGDQSYWDSSQMMKNLVFTNPGFEGLKYRTILHCITVTANTCTDDNPYNGQPAGYWSGAGYLVMTGKSLEATGSILSNTATKASCGNCGPTIVFDKNLNLAVGDYLALTQFVPGAGDAGWWDNTTNGATISSETNDLSPNTPGQQAIILSAASADQLANVTQYFDTFSNRSFIQMNGTFSVTFRAKGAGGNNQLTVEAQRLEPGAPTWLYQTVTLTNSWQDYTLVFTANEGGSSVGPVQLAFTASGSVVKLDDVSMAQTNSSGSNPTAFRDDVVNALLQLNPGTIRMMAAGAALGSDIPNQLALPFARYRGGFNADGTTQPNIAYGIHEFLQLCATVGADPWITIPTATTPQEMQDLILYLSGTGSDNWSSLRIARGQTHPWTSVFNKIHIELGNETWNGDFKGESMVSNGYPQWANIVFAAARQTSGFSGGKFDLVLDGWSDVPWYNSALLATSTQHDSIDIAPYLMFSLNNEPQSTMFGAMMAEPEMYETPVGVVARDIAAAQAAPTRTNVNVYETNVGAAIGKPTQAQLNALAPSLAAGIANADNMLQMMRAGIQYQNAFALPQFQFRRSDGQTVPLWGIVIDMGTTNRRRPQFLTEAMANSVIGGNMLQTTQMGANPTWNQPLSSDGVQLNGAHFLQSFAFLNGNIASAVIFNLSLTNALPVTFSGQNAPTGQVQMTQITSANVTDNNETADVVQPVYQTLNGFDPGSGVTLPPCSMTVLSWTSTLTQSPQFSVPPGTFSTTQTLALINTTAGATTYFTTDGSAPTTSSTLYTGPISIASTTTVNAISVAPNFGTSPVATALYTIQPYAVAPSFQVPAGIYSTTQYVGIAASTPGATIYYTTDGSTPSTSSNVYKGAIAVNHNLTIQAIVAAPNYSNSPVATAVYTIAPPTASPTFSTASGSFTHPFTLAILDSMPGTIYYTTDGSTPTAQSNLYTSTFVVSTTETIKAIDIAPGYSSSVVSTANYVVNTLAASPVLSVPGGTYNIPQTVSLSAATPGSIIYYTLDGSIPSTSSPVYSGPIVVNTTENLQAAAIAPGYLLSFISSGVFHMVAATPVLSVPAGSYGGPQTLNIADLTPGAVIFYTTNGKTPSTESTPYTGPITINGSETVKALAGLMGYSNSSVVSAQYTITSGSSGPGTGAPTFSPAAGSYVGAQLVTISDSTAGVTIYYTTDGTAPTTQSTRYSGPFWVSASETVTAEAFLNPTTGGTVSSASYIINQTSSFPYANGFTSAQIHLNGSATISGSNLQLTNGSTGQGSTAWYSTPVGISSFTTDFDFILPDSEGDGFTFTIQNAPAGVWALGANAGGLGYAGVKDSVAIAFNFSKAAGAGAESLGVYTGGAIPTGNSINLEGTGLDLHSGDSFHVHVVNSGSALAVTLTDNTTGVTATENFHVNVSSVVGASTAYIGFSGSTGGYVATQNILDWNFAN